MTIHLIEDGHIVSRTVTFGQPRFTTGTGVQHLGDLPILRVVDENDIIPIVPPAISRDRIHGPYEHVGPEIILLEGPHYVFLSSRQRRRGSSDLDL